ncbi:MAG TPA: serine/threonine-protein kinase [Gemmatimonadaceae bacterium]|jgi:serine/threonine-protein kinase
MIDLREQLAQAVSGAYKIDQELGGGGMSRVFTADDLALGRRVVIKVLHPELAAGVNAERFKREVQLAARLQHPHIVPVLTAGEVDGLPYYIMPFVKGESLNARLKRGPLPVADVINYIGDVAKALSFAHSEGVVHRDIKPDNILISGGAATVADFGIAKAISSARREVGEGLTSVGTSLGTAGYMAPEQVAGDPSLDHRADIYALGCVAYELLSGASPFAGKSGQQMLAAHVLEQPVPIRDKRPETPPALADLVMRCMAKDPADRPQSGEAILAALDNISLGNTGVLPVAKPAKSSARGWMIGVIAAAVIVLLAVVLYTRRNSMVATNGASTTLAVAPFEVFDPSLSLWKEGLVDVLSRNLDGAVSMHTVSPSAAIKQWRNARVGRDEAFAFAKRVGAQLVVYGSLESAGRDVASATVYLLDTRSPSNQPNEIEVHDSTARMDRLTDSLSVRLLSMLGASTSGSTRSLGSGSLPAIKAFLLGAQYFRSTRFDSAAAAFRQAVAIDPTFAIAHTYLNQALGWTGGTPQERAIEAMAGAHYLRPGLAPLDSLIIAAVGHYADTTGNFVANERQAYLTAQAATQRYPNDAFARYLYADFRFHTDPKLSDHEALSLFTRAIEADSNFAPSYIHTIELTNRYGADADLRVSRAYLARSAGDREADGLRLAADLETPGGTQDPKLRAYIDTVTPSVIHTAATALARLPDSAETNVYLMRVASQRPDAPRIEEISPVLSAALGMHGHIAEAWRIGLASKSQSASEIAALGLVNGDSAGKVMKSWLRDRNNGTFFALPALAMAHDTTSLKSVITTADSFSTKMPPQATKMERAAIAYIALSARAYYQLARADTVAATKGFDQLSDSMVHFSVDQFIRARLIARTDPKRAFQMMTQKKVTGDLISVARELEIGRLGEKVGEIPRAVDAYAFVANAWQNTENEQLKNAVKESRDALKRLDSDGRLRAQLAASR